MSDEWNGRTLGRLALRAGKAALSILIVLAIVYYTRYSGPQTVVTASNGSISAGGNITLNEMDPLELRKIIDDANNRAATLTEDRDRALLKAKQISTELGITQSALLAFFRILGQQDVPLDELKDTLIQIADQYISVQQRLLDLAATDPASKRLLRQAQEELNAGILADADQHLQEAEESEILAARRMQQSEPDSQSRAQQHIVNAAMAEAVRGQLASMRLRYDDAAIHFAKAATLLPDTEYDDFAELRGEFLLEEATAHYFYGLKSESRQALEKAVIIFRSVLDSKRIVKVPNFAEGQAHLGNALVKLAEHSYDPVQMNEAIGAFRLALGERAIPLEMGLRLDTLDELGAVLLELDHPHEAVEVYRSAVTACLICLRKRGPAWAAAQVSLGVALVAVAAKEGNVDDAAEGIAAIRDSLTVLTREQDGIEWARAQYSLGYALTISEAQAPKSGGMIEQAIAAIRNALQIISPDHDRLDWALAQAYLGEALEAAGQQEAANEAFENALHDANLLGPSMTDMIRRSEQHILMPQHQ